MAVQNVKVESKTPIIQHMGQVLTSVNSCGLVRVFHLASWGEPLLFWEPAELQSPIEAAAPPAQLFHCLSALGIEEQPRLLHH